MLLRGFESPVLRFKRHFRDWETFRFMCQHPLVQASGYGVSIDRDDYRTTLDDIDAEHSTPRLRTAAVSVCTDAETELEGSLECF
jgi:hypothetical protein